MTPFFFGRGADAFDPFPVDAFDLFERFPLPSSSFPAPASAGRRLSFPCLAVGGELSSFFRGAAPVDWKETPSAHVLKADLPGVKKGEVKVEVEDGRVLQISGEHSREREEKTHTWHRVERSSGKFLRRFVLPENAKVDGVKAALENGVLTVTVPKEAAAAGKPNVRSVEISG